MESEIPQQQSSTLSLHKSNEGTTLVQKSKEAKQSRQEETSVLPDELILKIVARMGFPSVFKARILSRTWYFRFPLPSQRIRSVSTGVFLQNEITSVSSKWTSYSPVLFGKGKFLGFDRASGGWKWLLLSLSHLPVEDWSSMDVLTSAGSLMCAITKGDQETLTDSRVFVTNLLTRSWQAITLCKEHGTVGSAKRPDFARILPVGFDSYKVLLLFKRSANVFPGELGSSMVSQLYDRNLKTWTSIKSEPMNPEIGISGEFVPNSAYVHGKLYCMCRSGDRRDIWQLWVHLVADFHRFSNSNPMTDPVNAWIAIPHPFRRKEIVDGGVLLCGDKIMVVVWSRHPITLGEDLAAIEKHPHKFYTPKNAIRIFQLLPNSLRLVEVWRGPSRTVFGVGLYKERIKFASDADYIYIGQAMPGVPMMTYNVHTCRWNCLPPPCYTLASIFDDFTTMEQFPFAPGLNPFAVV